MNGDGWISKSEFQEAMSHFTSYSVEEIDNIMECADLDKDGRLDYMEFTNRFHMPAEQIGFDLCVLITTLTEHLPGDTSLEFFKQTKSPLFKYFESSLGRIEIIGKSRQVERVYFEIRPSWINQWRERQVQDSKREFLQHLDVHSQREKLSAFIDYCEDTIFEIQYASEIRGTESEVKIEKAESHNQQHHGNRMGSSDLLTELHSQVTGWKSWPIINTVIFLLNVLTIFVTLSLTSIKNKLKRRIT